MSVHSSHHTANHVFAVYLCRLRLQSRTNFQFFYYRLVAVVPIIAVVVFFSPRSFIAVIVSVRRCSFIQFQQWRASVNKCAYITKILGVLCFVSLSLSLSIAALHENHLSRKQCFIIQCVHQSLNIFILFKLIYKQRFKNLMIMI